MCAFVADREVSLSPARTSFFATNSTAADSRTPDLPLCNYAMFNERNKNHAKADWQFTIANAHVKLKRNTPRYETVKGEVVYREHCRRPLAGSSGQDRRQEPGMPIVGMDNVGPPIRR